MTGLQSGQDPVISRSAGLIEAEVHGEIVGLHIDNGVCYGFNRTASRIWTLLAEPRRLSELVTQLAREHKVDTLQCERDVRALLDDLGSDGLVHMTSGGSSRL